MTALAVLSDFVVRAAVPRAALGAARNAFLDTIGVMLKGSRSRGATGE